MNFRGQFYICCFEKAHTEGFSGPIMQHYANGCIKYGSAIHGFGRGAIAASLPEEIRRHGQGWLCSSIRAYGKVTSVGTGSREDVDQGKQNRLCTPRGGKIMSP